MERSNANGMEQVIELLALIDWRRLDGVIVAMNFTFWRIQPSKERVLTVVNNHYKTPIQYA